MLPHFSDCGQNRQHNRAQRHPAKKTREIAIRAAQKQRMGNLGRNAAHEKHYKFRATVREKSVAK
ncbi:hypothetical protein [Burkholderia multivorans]|uniref:hypothetical protein n=1 Tax=Burkholderia multivorans TaxID=87883 RepID=UPI0011B262B6|nr:hypothetical protein [Burkholderia multivorans]MBJ9624980.1 hypothetical protein [Burkholderia multivorans]